jgi:hypothetical protein
MPSDKVLERCYLHSPTASGEIWVLTISTTVSSDPAVSIFSSTSAPLRVSIPFQLSSTLRELLRQEKMAEKKGQGFVAPFGYNTTMGITARR